MNKVVVFCVAMAVGAAANAQTESPKYSYDDLVPNASEARVETFVTQFLNNYHYRKFNVDDSLSTKVWSNYLESVDPSKTYFTKAEIDNFEKYRYTIDEALLSGDLTAAFDVFNQYRKKYRIRNAFIKSFLAKPFNYNSNDTYEASRTKSKWANSETELDDIWNKAILSQALSMKLSYANDSTKAKANVDSIITATLKKRYEMYETRVLKLRPEDVFQTYINAFTEIIDPHTSYMIPSAAAQFNIDMSQSLEGIGATLVNEGEYVMIKEIVPGGPLFKSNEPAKNNYITAVAQGDTDEFQDIIGWLTDDAVKLIRGKKGSVVRLKLLPSNAPIGTEPHVLRLVREKIKLEEAVAKASIDTVMSDKKSYKIGVIDLPMFYRDFADARKSADFQSTTKDVKRFLEDFKTKNVDAVLIDLRNNGGGSLTEAINLTGLFIPEGPVVQRRTGHDKVDVEDDTDPSVTYDGPLLILQNRFSASASEIFAGAIQDYHRGLIVGERSYGKGTVQQLIDIDQFLNSPRQASRNNVGVGGIGFDNKDKYGQLKLTTEKFYRITGNSTQLKGVEPDVHLPTPFNADEMGESSQPTALPYDQINAVTFEKAKNINDKVILKVNTKYNARLKSDEELKDLILELDEYKAQKDKNEFSLNYTLRLKEKEAMDHKNKAVKKLNKSKSKNKDKEDDIYLKESERILIDLSNSAK